jgi:hypothetical protein
MNAPSRIRAVLQRARNGAFEANTGAVVVWAKALPLLEVPESDLEDSAAFALQALRGEVDLTIAGLEAFGLDPDLYSGKLGALRGAMAPRLLGSNWTAVAGPITDPETHTILGWAAHFMPKEAEVPAETVAELQEAFQRLREGIDAAALPPAMRAYAERQLRALRVALSMHGIRGIAAVTEALETAYGVASRAAPEMAAEAAAAPEAAGFVNRVNAALARALEVCGSVDKVYKGGSAMISMAETVQKMIGNG